jgi:hypothetical protein
MRKLQMGDYDDLCEMYGVSAGDPEGLDKIIDEICACDNLRPKYRNRVPKGQWIRASLNKQGDLDGWQKRIKENFPFPEIGEVVDKKEEKGEIIGYLCTSYKNGEPQWLRVVWQETPNPQKIEDSDGFDDDVPF